MFSLRASTLRRTHVPRRFGVSVSFVYQRCSLNLRIASSAIAIVSGDIFRRRSSRVISLVVFGSLPGMCAAAAELGACLLLIAVIKYSPNSFYSYDGNAPPLITVLAFASDFISGSCGQPPRTFFLSRAARRSITGECSKTGLDSMLACSLS